MKRLLRQLFSKAMDFPHTVDENEFWLMDMSRLCAEMKQECDALLTQETPVIKKREVPRMSTSDLFQARTNRFLERDSQIARESQRIYAERLTSNPKKR